MDCPFDRALRLSNGRTVITVASISEAGAFLLQHWPPKRRRRPSYRTAVNACVKALGGRVEPEVARNALVLALEDLAPSHAGPNCDPAGLVCPPGRAKSLILLVPVERIELPTFGLQNRCTTAVLHRRPEG